MHIFYALLSQFSWYWTILWPLLRTPWISCPLYLNTKPTEITWMLTVSPLSVFYCLVWFLIEINPPTALLDVFSQLNKQLNYISWSFYPWPWASLSHASCHQNISFQRKKMKFNSDSSQCFAQHFRVISFKILITCQLKRAQIVTLKWTFFKI